MTRRSVWIDAARGLSVCAVVLMHVTEGFSLPTDASSPLNTFRMPVLLAISGIFLAGRFEGGWGDRRNIHRVANLAYLYALWVIVYYAFSQTSPLTFPGSIPDAQALLIELVLPTTTTSTLWFIYALALYTAIIVSLRHVPGRFIYSGFFALALVTTLLPPDMAGQAWIRILHYGTFFSLGVFGRKFLVRLASDTLSASTLLPRLLAALAIYIPLSLAASLLSGAPILKEVMWQAESTAGIAVAVLAVALLCTFRPLARPLAALGTRTLPIYVLHPLAMLAIAAAPPAIDAMSRLGALAGPVAAVGIISACLLLNAVTRIARMGWLFGIPKALTFSAARSEFVQRRTVPSNGMS